MKMKKSSLNEAIYEKINLPENASVADLGCRDAGYLCGLLEEFPGRITKAVGVDITDSGFGSVPYSSPVELRVMSCAGKLEFPDEAFDLVLAKDMLECITDKETFVREVHRILKPGGAVLCVNCDFDSIVYNGGDKKLITKAVHAYAATKQSWMDDLDSWMGRRTYGVFHSTGCFQSSVAVHSVVETAYEEGSFGFDFSRHIGWLAEENTGALTSEEYQAFLKVLEDAAQEGSYLFTKPYYLYLGIKPE